MQSTVPAPVVTVALRRRRAPPAFAMPIAAHAPAVAPAAASGAEVTAVGAELPEMTTTAAFRLAASSASGFGAGPARAAAVRFCG